MIYMLFEHLLKEWFLSRSSIYRKLYFGLEVVVGALILLLSENSVMAIVLLFYIFWMLVKYFDLTYLSYKRENKIWNPSTEVIVLYSIYFILKIGILSCAFFFVLFLLSSFIIENEYGVKVIFIILVLCSIPLLAKLFDVSETIRKLRNKEWPGDVI